MREYIVKAMQLVKPYQFKLNEINKEYRDDCILVKPTLGSICAADLRYYTGNRREDALKRKLPMALLHEGIGIIAEDTKAEFKKGDRVIIVPNIPGYIHNKMEYLNSELCCTACALGTGFENHCENVLFLSSGFDGMMQNYMIHPNLCTVKIPDQVPDEIAVLSELITVAYNACHKAQKIGKINANSNIMIFGDGPVGYSIYSVLSYIYKIPKQQLYVIGKHSENLEKFEKAQTLIYNELNFPNKNIFDISFECVGGKGITSAVDQSIKYLNPGGLIVLMGVSEEKIPINTRDILEKGLILFGSSRSSRIDYPKVLEYMKNKDFQDILLKLNSNNIFEINNCNDANLAFDFAASKQYWGKVYLKMDFD